MILEDKELTTQEKEKFQEVQIQQWLHLKILIYLLQQIVIINMMEQLFIEQMNKTTMLLKMYMIY